MTRYADPELCPDCRAPMPFGVAACPTCGLSFQGPLAAQLFAALTEADRLLVAMRAPAGSPAGSPAGLPGELPAGLRAGSAGSSAGSSAGQVAAPPGDELDDRLGPPLGYGLGYGLGHRLGSASVPTILLGLGALCLLVAALVFLAVSWSAMGVAGRTATLLAFTGIAGGLSWWAARRGLGGAAEALAVVAMGLLTLDLFGARDAGWFGAISLPGFQLVAGVVVALAGAGAAVAVRRTPVRGLVGAEVIAALAVAMAAHGATGIDLLVWSPRITLVVITTAAAATAAALLRLRWLATGAGAVSLLAWVVLALAAFGRALAHPTLRELWLDLEGWPLLAAAALIGAPAFVARLPLAARQVAAAVAALALAGTLLVPFSDGPSTTARVAVAVLVLGSAAVAWWLPARWRPSLTPLLGVTGAWLAVTAAALGLAGLLRIVEAGAALWGGAAADSFAREANQAGPFAPWLLPVAVVAVAAALLALARTHDRVDQVLAPIAAIDVLAAGAVLTTVLTLALYPVPTWVTLVLLVGAAAAFVARAIRHDDLAPLALGSVLLALALVQSLHAQWHTFAFLLGGVALAGVVHLRWRSLEVSLLAGVLVPPGVGALSWTVGALLDASVPWTALAALLVIAALVLALPYVDRSVRVAGPASHARLGVDAAALGTAVVITLLGVDLAEAAPEATWLAVYLTVMGATGSTLALLRPDRRGAGWVGGALLAAATWVRLADLGVETPEAYTLPSALALLTVGLVHLRRHPGASTVSALSPGLGLALTPSLLWVLADPVTLRSLLLGAACLGLVLAGLRVRWSAPLAWAALVGTLLVLRHATPVAEAVPRWALIGSAGALLVAMGITWEQRVREARAVAGYVRALR